MTNWTETTGYPVINVKLDGKTASITQKRFYLRPIMETDNNSWIIPLTWISSSQPKFKPENVVWMNTSRTTLNVEPDNWIVFNVQSIGTIQNFLKFLQVKPKVCLKNNLENKYFRFLSRQL